MTKRLLSWHTVLLASLLAVGLTGCVMLPGQGPLARQVEAQGSPLRSVEQDYLLIDLTPEIVQVLSRFKPLGFRGRLRNASGYGRRSRIGVGDVLAISIWEAGEGGLFSNAQSKNVTFPAIEVGRSGRISIPYLGQIRVAGRTPFDVEQTIVEGLKDQAIQPQAIVNIAKNESNTVVLSGEVNSPGRYPLAVNGDRLLDSIAVAGGAKYPARETIVTVLRGKSNGKQLLTNVINQPGENIHIVAGDRIYLSQVLKKFTVLGAIQKPGVYTFPEERVNMLEAIAMAGGLIDERSDATAVFGFRYESADVIRSFMPEYDGQFGETVPTVYRLNLLNPHSYIFARTYFMQDKDVIYVSNSKSTEVAKVLSILDPIIRSSAVAANLARR